MSIITSRAGTAPAVAATVVSSLATLGAALLPWLRTGRSNRSAFALARSAEAVGFIDTPGRRVLVVSWYLLPFLVAAVWTAAAAGRPGAAGLLGLVVGSMSLAAGSMVWGMVGAGVGPVAAVAAGGAAFASAAWLLILSSRRRRNT